MENQRIHGARKENSPYEERDQSKGKEVMEEVSKGNDRYRLKIGGTQT